MSQAAAADCIAVLKNRASALAGQPVEIQELSPPAVPDHGLYGIVFSPRKTGACSLDIMVNPHEFHVLVDGDMWVSEVPLSADLLESICDAVQSGKVRRSESRIAPGIVDAGGVIEADPEPVYLFSQEGRGLVQDLIDRQSGHVPGKLEKAYVPWL